MATVQVTGTQTKGQTPIYRNASSASSLPTSSFNCYTLYDIFQRGLSLSPNLPYLGTLSNNSYNWQTYSQISNRRSNFGSGLLSLIPLPPQTPIGIYSINKPEWIISDLVCSSFNLISVALYDTLGSDSLNFILQHSQLKIVICGMPQLHRLLKVGNGLELIVVMDRIPVEMKHWVEGWASERKVRVIEMVKVEEIGQQKLMEHRKPNPSDVACISYTSGTTGNPKGVVLTHQNYAAAVGGAMRGIELDGNDILISYLPLAHVFERVMELGMTLAGGRIGFYRGDVLKLVQDIQILQPTVFPSVPRLFNRIYEKLLEGTIKAPGLKGRLFSIAYAHKLANLQNGSLTHPLWDALLFSKVKAVIGGNVRFLISAGAPINSDILTFFRIVFGCHVIEGYGQTETAGASCFTPVGDFTVGHVGVPNVCNEVKLVDVPEMRYFSTDKPCPRGEICFRGPNVFKGYYKDDAKTREVLDSDGWCHTGDIGVINERGRVVVIDRRKNIFKLAQGEYIAPEKIENVYLKAPFVLQIFVYGDSLERFLVGIVVPDADKVKEWHTGKTCTGTTPDEVRLILKERGDELTRLVLEGMQKTAKLNGLHGFEMVKKIYLEAEPFSVETILTPTMKIKRNEAKERYAKEIRAMYGKNSKL